MSHKSNKVSHKTKKVSHRRKNIVTQVGKHYYRGCKTQQHKLGNIVAQVKNCYRIENIVTQVRKHCHTNSETLSHKFKKVSHTG